MIGNIDEFLAQTWARRKLTWEHHGQQVPIIGESPFVPDRIQIMSGTPHGTVFGGIHTSHKILGFLAWLFGGWRRLGFHPCNLGID